MMMRQMRSCRFVRQAQKLNTLVHCNAAAFNPAVGALKHTRSFHSSRSLTSFDPFAAEESSHDNSAPLHLAVIGSGISGLTLSYQLQRLFRERGRGANIVIDLYDQSNRTGGWMRTQQIQPYQIERGPRSFMYRESDPHSETSLQLVRQLHLGGDVLLADSNAARRFVWNRSQSPNAAPEEGTMIMLPAGLRSFWSSPHRSLLLSALRREWSTPALRPSSEAESDESVYDFVSRRFGEDLARELIDPLIAGIYAGDPRKLSMQSCLGRVSQMERQSGGVLRDIFSPPPEVKKAKHDARVKAFDRAQALAADEDWMAAIRREGGGGIYSFKGGVSTLPNRLAQRLKTDAHDPYAALLPGQDARVNFQQQQKIVGMKVNAQNKPQLIVESGSGTTETKTFDHVFSTLPSHALHQVLSHPQSSLPLPKEIHSNLLSTLSPTSMVGANVWVVNLVYDADVLSSDRKGFGILVPSAHAIPGMEVLGITFDSCVFPQHAADPSKPETRLTVMIGGDRHLQYADAKTTSPDDMSLLALQAVQTMLGVDHRKHKPVYVNSVLHEKCIPQFYVGHAAKLHDVFQYTQHVAYIPSTIKLPTFQPLKPLTVEKHKALIEAESKAASQPVLKPFTILGTSFGGVSLNDCIHHATGAAKDFVKRVAKA